MKNNLAVIASCYRLTGFKQTLTGYAGDLYGTQSLLIHEAKFSNNMQELF